MARFSYTRLRDKSDQQFDRFGVDLTLRGEPVPADIVTGAPATDGNTRTVRGVVTEVDLKVFDASLVQQGDLMLALNSRANPQQGERWVQASDRVYTFIEIKRIIPDNTTPIAFLVLVRG